jgi:hypothetical protein
MGTGQEHLNFAAANVVDPWLKKAAVRKENDSIYLYNGWATTTNWSERRISESPINSGVDYGGEAIFRIDKSKFQLGPVQLHTTVSALTAGAGTTLHNRFVPFAAYAAIDYVKVLYSVNELERWTGRQLQLYHRMFKGIRDNDSMNELVAGDKSPTERDVLAASAQTWIVDLPLGFTVDPRRYLIVAGLASQIEIRVKYKALANIVQTDNSTNLPTGSITTITLTTTNVHVQKNEKAVQQARLQREKRGVVYLVDQWEEQLNNTVSSGATSATVQLNTFKGGATEIMFVVRAATSDDATAANLGNDPFDYVKITSWELKTGQITLVDLVTDAEQKHVLNRKMHSGVPGDHIYGASWSAHPEDPMNAWGHITFAGMATPTLTVNFTAALSGTHYIDVYLRTKNVWHHHGGEIRALFT